MGRNDDIIKTLSYRIVPFEVESVLIEHDAVVESAVVASLYELQGYVVKRFVMLNDDIQASKALVDELFTFSERHLAKYKVTKNTH